MRRKLERVAAALLFALTLWPAATTLRTWRTFRGDALLRVDYSLYVATALLGLRQGWHHLYDLEAQRRLWQQDVPGLWWFLNVYTPALSLAMVPFTFLSRDAGYALWGTLMLGCLLLSWALLAPGDWIMRLAQLPMLFAPYPVGQGLWMGQVISLEMAALALAYFALRRGRERTAGALLAVLVLKPQGLLLVPFALLAAGRKKLFATWAACVGLIGVVLLAVVGFDGAFAYGQRLSYAQSHLQEFWVAWSYSLARRMPGPALRLVEVAAVALTLLAARRHRESPELVIAVGLVGSLVAAPFLHLDDFMLLFPAAWLLLRALPGPLPAAAMLLGYGAMLLSADDAVGGRWILLFICLLLPALAAFPPRRQALLSP